VCTSLFGRYFVPNPSFGLKGSPADTPKELELLKGITGFAEPGKLTALMGGSGAGKKD
jgi:ABC-type multidrug transport system ATPase subunit